jgi:uncharacterized protein YndB with AHSA1/START domain
MAAHDRDPQPPKALQAHHRAAGGLSRPPAVASHQPTGVPAATPAINRFRASAFAATFAQRPPIEAEAAVADGERWADGRTFSFERLLAAPPDVVWRHWVEPDLLASWWAVPSMTVADCALEPTPGGRALLEYRDAEGRRYLSEGQVHLAVEPEHLVFDLSVLDAAGAVSFTGHYDLSLSAVSDGTHLRLDLRITDTTVEAVPYIAGIATGWSQVLNNLAAHTKGKEAQP